MYDLNDTIAAFSSPPVSTGRVGKSIIRISGESVYEILEGSLGVAGENTGCGIEAIKIKIDNEFLVDALLYKFYAPDSYTGEDLAEIHFFAPSIVLERVFERFMGVVRQAGPGEFTLRAYLNGRLDLSQAEAVAKIVASSNRFQLGAAEKLLAGKLSESISQVREEILDILSLIEGGLDFSTEGIEFITKDEAAERIAAVKDRLGILLSGSIRYEEMIELPSVGLAGAANAGKSSLLNSLIGKERSIVSNEQATTRDVLTGIIELGNLDCAIFDCAGLSMEEKRAGVLDELAQEAAVEALRAANVVVFCVDVSKEDLHEDVDVFKFVDKGELLLAATKCDLLDDSQLTDKLSELRKLFSIKPMVISAQTGHGLGQLRDAVEEKIMRLQNGVQEGSERIGITERHRSLVEEAIKNLEDAAEETVRGNDEIASMLLRASYEGLSSVEREDVDEAILERIFSSFCIGK
jgi:tRNA modification GTPase